MEDHDAGELRTEGRRILVIANRTCPCPTLLEEIVRRAGADGEVLIVAPALNSRLRFLTDDTDRAERAAEERLTSAVSSLREGGVSAEGAVGDANPVQAAEDAMRAFPADEILLSTFPPGESNWLERDLVDRATERFDVPVTHLTTTYGLETAA